MSALCAFCSLEISPFSLNLLLLSFWVQADATSDDAYAEVSLVPEREVWSLLIWCKRKIEISYLESGIELF